MAVPRFPTLAEQLARLSPEDDPGSRGVLLIADAGASAVAPSDSVVQVSATTLGELRETLAQHDSDVLLSGGVPLTAQAIERLCRGLAADPSCATVSIDPHVRPSPPGVPPQTVDRPRRGAVLVRRDHLLLALDEEPVAGLSDDPRPAASEPGDLVGALLGRLERPGFVHRALPSGGPAATSARPPSSPSAARRTASVVFDGRSFAYTLSGTQVQTIGLLGGLVRAGAEITVALTAELHPTVRAELGELVDEMRFVEHSRVGRVELFHKPHQFWSLHDLAESLSMADRVVLTQLDMILERTPAYRRSREKWEKQRATTAAALASVDQIGFLSAAAALDAASDGELELDRATVVHCGVDHLTGRRVPDPACPLGGRPYLLAVGNAFWHKNRTFALRLVGWLVERQGWDGGLVLAGGHPDVGSSLEAEARLLHASPVLADRVRDLGHISDEERLALLSGAELTLFPSYYEGFGFVPFESAALGTACLYTYGSSMRELLPPSGGIPSFDVEEAGPFVASLLERSDRRREIVVAINEAAASLTWDRAAAGYLDVYERALSREPRRVSRRLLELVPGPERALKERSEILLVDVYRRRRGFRVAANAVVGAGQVAARGVRNARRLRRGGE